MTPAIRGSSRAIAPLTSRMQAADITKQALEGVDSQRVLLAQAYAGAASHTSVEFELGECITLLRKAEDRLRKAWGELAQLEMRFEDEE